MNIIQDEDLVDDTDDHGDHFNVVVSTFNVDGSLRMVHECCVCNLHNPELVRSAADIPYGGYVIALEIPLDIH